MSKKNFEEGLITTVEMKAEQPNEIDSIKESVKIVSDALILLNTKIENINNNNSKNMEKIIHTVDDFTEYQNKKIENYDSNFRIIRGKVNSFNDVAADMLNKIKNVCEKLEKGKFQDISQETERYADLLQNKFNEINSELDNFVELQVIIDQVKNSAERIDQIDINGKMSGLIQITEKISCMTEEFEENISKLADGVNNKRLIDKTNENINLMLEKTKNISDNTELLEDSLTNIIDNQCKEISNTLNNILEIEQKEKKDIKEFMNNYLKEKENLELLINNNCDSLCKTINKFVSYSIDADDKIQVNLKDYINNIIDNIEKILIENKDNKISIENKIENKSQLTIENFNILKSLLEDSSKQFDNRVEDLTKALSNMSDTNKNYIENALKDNNDYLIKNIICNKDDLYEKLNDNSKIINEKLDQVGIYNNEVISKLQENKEDIVNFINKMISVQNENTNLTANTINDNYNDFMQKNAESFSMIENINEAVSNITNNEINNLYTNITNSFNEQISNLQVVVENINNNQEMFLKEFSENMKKEFNMQIEKRFENMEDILNNIDTKIIDKNEFNTNKQENIDKIDELNNKINKLEEKLEIILQENKNLKAEILQNKAVKQEMNKSKNDIINLEKIANSGDPGACLQVGNMYYLGIDIGKDIDKALKYYELGSSAGNLECRDKIFEIYIKLAEKGQGKYQYLVGKAYLEGKLINQDIDIALKWYDKAARNGIEEAKKVLVRMYTMMAKKNDTNAMYNIGMCYYNGFCVEKDIVKAYSYFNQAASLGNTEAIKMLNKQS